MLIISKFGGSGPVGNSTYSDTYSNIPAAGASGDLFFPTDGVAIYMDDGAAWQPWSGGATVPMTLPSTSGWSWVNQNSATATTTSGGIELYGPLSAAGLNLYVRSTPSPPYTITLRFVDTSRINNTAGGSQNAGSGFCWRESGSGKIVGYYPRRSTLNARVQIRKWNSPTSFNSDYGAADFPRYSLWVPEWWRMEDNNTNRIVSFSRDGLTWMTYHSVGRTDFITADQAGIYTAPGVQDCYTTLFSWEEA